MNAAERIVDLFEHRKGERLIWNGFLPNRKKNQYWDPQKNDIDWDLHFSGKLKQGGRLSSEDGTSKALVVDIDREKDSPLIPADKICEDAFKLDHKLRCFQSPSKNWHAYKFFHKPKPTKDAAEEAMKLGRAFKKLGYKVDFGKTLPKSKGSQTGINFPFHTHQQPYDVRGNVMSQEQFIHAYRFQNFPLIVAATNLKQGDGGRPNTLCMIAALLEQKNKFQYIDEVIKNFGDEFDDEKYLKRIKEEGIHKQYIDIGPDGISAAITNIVHFDYKVKNEIPEPPPNFWEGAEEFEDYAFNNGTNKKKNHSAWRQGILGHDLDKEELKPIQWVVEDLIAPGLNLIAGKSKIGKSFLAFDLSYQVQIGGTWLGHKCSKGKVLHYSLEDLKRRTKNRWQTMGIKPLETNYQFRDRQPKIPLLTLGLEEEIEDWIKNTPDAKLVIIDPYQKVKFPKNKLNAYENDNYNLQNLQTLATKYEIAIVLVHHLKKQKADDVFDEITGSAGIQSNSDSMIVISSDRKKTKNPILQCLPKDAEQQEFEIALNPKCIWENLGKPGMAALTKIQNAITKAMKDKLERTSKEIIIKVQVENDKENWTDKHIQKEVTRLVEQCWLTKTKRGHYKQTPY